MRIHYADRNTTSMSIKSRQTYDWSPNVALCRCFAIIFTIPHDMAYSGLALLVQQRAKPLRINKLRLVRPTAARSRTVAPSKIITMRFV